MGRLTGHAKDRARAGFRSLASVRAQKELRARGVVVSRRVLAERSLSECIDAINWATNGRPLGVRPAFIRQLLDEGRARLRPGICQSCACTERRPCRPPCAWAPGTLPARTLCSACDIDALGTGNPVRAGPWP